MTIYEIPLTSDDANYKQRVSLSGTVYIMKFHYNEFLSTWVFSLYDSANVLIATTPARPGFNLFDRMNFDNAPEGELFFISMLESEDVPGRYDLGAKVTLIYVEGLTDD